MTSCSSDIKTLLEADSSLALEFGTDLFIGELPETPNQCCTIVDTGGYETKIGPYYSPTVQMLFRGDVGEYEETYSLAQAVTILLHEYSGTPSGSTFYYTGIWSLGDPFFIGVDENERPLFSINFRIQRR